MRTTNAMQLKARIKARAQASGVSPQLLMQDYLLERLLERLSRSSWRENVVVKGGMLIASLIGVDNRVTKDLDTTVQGFALTCRNAEQAFREICSTASDDGIEFEFVRTESIREMDEYAGVRIFLKANYPPMSVPITVDVTAGDAITPGAVPYNFPLAFDSHSIPLLAYPLETVLAEKLETVIVRGRANTRLRDFYDIHALWSARHDAIRPSILREALFATCSRRGTIDAIGRHQKEMAAVARDRGMLDAWERYRREYSYAEALDLKKACETVCEIMRLLGSSGITSVDDFLR